jgi:hypothetical protein
LQSAFGPKIFGTGIQLVRSALGPGATRPAPHPQPPRRGSRLPSFEARFSPGLLFLSGRAALSGASSEAVEGKNGGSRGDPPPWLSTPYCWSAAAQVLASAFHVPPAASQSALFLALAASPAKAGPVTAAAIAKASIETKLFMIPSVVVPARELQAEEPFRCGHLVPDIKWEFLLVVVGTAHPTPDVEAYPKEEGTGADHCGKCRCRIACSMPSKPKAAPLFPLARGAIANRVHGRGVGVRSASARRFYAANAASPMPVWEFPRAHTACLKGGDRERARTLQLTALQHGILHCGRFILHFVGP